MPGVFSAKSRNLRQMTSKIYTFSMARLFAVVFLVLALGFGYFAYSRPENSVTSPVGKVFGANAPKAIENTWFPKLSGGDVSTDKLGIGAKSALLVDYDTGAVLYAKNPKDKLPAASTIKIMTALLALDAAKPPDLFTVSEYASKVGENSMGLTEGEQLTLSELLYGLVLVSGNDAAVTLAEGVSGSEDVFVSQMNQKTQALGLSDTKFVNASGLDEDDREQFTTAYDLLTIARFLWEKYPQFRKVSATEHHFIDANSRHKAFDMYSDTNLLTTYPGVVGIKPGFTWNAGLCLVTIAENNGKRLLAVILGSDDRRGEMKELLDFGFAKYGIVVSHPALDL